VVQAAGATEPAAYLYTDPASGKISTLIPDATNPDNNNLLYENIKDGLSLEVMADKLDLLQGTFSSDGKVLSYVKDQYTDFAWMSLIASSVPVWGDQLHLHRRASGFGGWRTEQDDLTVHPLRPVERSADQRPAIHLYVRCQQPAAEVRDTQDQVIEQFSYDRQPTSGPRKMPPARPSRSSAWMPPTGSARSGR